MTTILHYRRLDWLRTFVPFAVVYAVVKSANLLGAVWMAHLMDNMASYGVFEYAFTVGILLSIPLNIGMQGAYPYFILEQRRSDLKVVFDAHAFWVVSGVLGILLLQALLGNLTTAITFNLSILIGGIIALQVLSAAICKSHQLVLRAVLLEGGLFLVINAYNLWVWWNNAVYDLLVVQYCGIIYLIGFWIVYGRSFYRQRTRFSWANYLHAFHFGQSIVTTSVLFMLLTGGGKVLIGHFLGMEMVGQYAYYLRFASCLFLIFQALNIFFFKKIYQTKTQALDRHFAVYLSFLFLMGLIIGFVFPVIYTGLLLPNEDSNQYLPMFWLLLCQVIFWAYTALNEIIIYREALSVPMSKHLACLLLGFVGAVYLVHQLQLLNLILFIQLNITSLFVATELQSKLLHRRRQINLRDARWVSRILFVLLWISTLTYAVFLL